MEDRLAIELVKRGDLGGLEILVRRYQVRAVQVAYLILGNRQSAEDIVQTAFLKVAQKIHQFEDNRPFGPWFFRIVRNDAIKGYSRDVKKLSLDAAEATETFTQWLTDGTLGPEELADTAENRQAIWEAMRRLTPIQRDALVMRYYLDMRDREIATETQRSLSSVKWSIHTAIERLRALLGVLPSRGSSHPAESHEDPERGANR